MDSMPEPSNPRTIEVADGHLVHTCCGKLDDAKHENFCPNWRPPTPAEKLIDETVERWRADHAAWKAKRLAELTKRLTNPDFEAGYIEGYLDCASIVTGSVSAETLAAVRSLAARRDSLTPAEVDAIRSALDG